MPVTLRIEIRKKAVAKFKKAAKEAFPKETLAYLIGEAVADLVMIEDVYFPEKVNESATDSYVHYQSWWPQEAYQHARDNDYEVLGDIHTHPMKYNEHYPWENEPIPSEGDLKTGWNGIRGICAVTETKAKRLVARIRFYGPIRKVEVTEVS